MPRHVIVIECPNCGGTDLNKDGKRENKAGTQQRYRCKDCSFRFSLGSIYPKRTIQYIKKH